MCEVENHRHSVRHGHFTEIRKQLKVRTFLTWPVTVLCAVEREEITAEPGPSDIDQRVAQAALHDLPSLEETVPALPARIRMICRDDFIDAKWRWATSASIGMAVSCNAS